MNRLLLRIGLVANAGDLTIHRRSRPAAIPQPGAWSRAAAAISFCGAGASSQGLPGQEQIHAGSTGRMVAGFDAATMVDGDLLRDGQSRATAAAIGAGAGGSPIEALKRGRPRSARAMVTI